jgi:hypothetical protein
VIGDAAFGGIRTATALLEVGLYFYFIGCVKQITGGFPKEYMNNWGKNIERGGLLTL